MNILTFSVLPIPADKTFMWARLRNGRYFPRPGGLNPYVIAPTDATQDAELDADYAAGELQAIDVSMPLEQFVLDSGPFYVYGVTYTPAADIVGQDTDTRLIELWSMATAISEDQTGGVRLAHLQFDADVNASAGSPISLTLTGSHADAPSDPYTPGNQHISWRSASVGAGLADPGGIVTVQWLPND